MLELVHLSEAIDSWADQYDAGLHESDTFHASLTFSEALSLADLLSATGNHDLAITLMEMWAKNDPEMAEHDNAEALKDALDRFKTEHEGQDK